MNRSPRRVLFAGIVASFLVAATALATSAAGDQDRRHDRGRARTDLEIQSLEGANNNRHNPGWGQAGTAYTRVAGANYADGLSKPVAGPNARYVSNRVFNDLNQNLFSENGVTRWEFTWGQFLDHTFGFRDGRSPGSAGCGSGHPVRRRGSDRGLHQHPWRCWVRAVQRLRGDWRHQPAPTDQLGQLVHRRVRCLRRHRAAA
jgi:hypothetical protein